MPVGLARRLELVLAFPAKVLCSALWVSGRGREEAIENSALAMLPRPMRRAIVLEADDARRRVDATLVLDEATVTWVIALARALAPGLGLDWRAEAEELRALGSITRSAAFVGDQGAVILPADGSGLRFLPEPVVTALPPPGETDWPLGDRGSEPAGGSRGVEEAVDAVFGDGRSRTAAFLVVHRGRVIAERYAPGFHRYSQLESWSMGKTLTAVLVGRLIHQGLLALDEPAPLPAWRGARDDRADITVRHLLQMSSGLEFSWHEDPPETWKRGVPDHVLPYMDATDAFAFAVGRPPEHFPGTVGRYRNCDPLALGAIVRRVVTGDTGESYLAWPQRALFDRIGVRRQVLETDAWGNFLLTGFDYGTARSWARLALLLAGDGVFGGERLLPEGFVAFAREPAPAWDEPVYGAQLWLNRTGEYPLPRDAYYLGGDGEQRAFVVPSHDLVVVRMGHRSGAGRARRALDRALRLLLRALG